jgi:hypothetical protein
MVMNLAPYENETRASNRSIRSGAISRRQRDDTKKARKRRMRRPGLCEIPDIESGSRNTVEAERYLIRFALNFKLKLGHSIESSREKSEQ